jgi:hypothetical protein
MSLNSLQRNTDVNVNDATDESNLSEAEFIKMLQLLRLKNIPYTFA